MSEAKLYTIPGSHPAISVAMMLEQKGIAYKRVDLLPVVSKAALRLNGFPGVTVPALKIDGRKLQGSRTIARELDELVPEPALLPADPARRDAVLEAERIGDEQLQHPLRQIMAPAALDHGAFAEHLDDRFPKRLGAVDHEQDRLFGVKAPVNQIGQ